MDIQALFGASIMEDCETYVGLPMVGGKSKVNTFKGLHERITKKVMGWKEKFISKADRRYLLKNLLKPSLRTLWGFLKSQRPYVTLIHYFSKCTSQGIF